MTTAVVGAARVVFGADTSDFDAGAKGVEGVLGRLQEAFSRLEQRVRSVGMNMTIGVTTPLAAMAGVAARTAGQFEAQMNRVQAALQGIDPASLKALSDQARTLGPAMGRSAAEAAGGIEALGLAGMDAATILGGGLDAALKLAAANEADVAASGALANDVLKNFMLTTSQLPGVVNKMTGALDAGKFGFNDYRLAASQAAGVAGPLGVSFDDFNVSIAALSNTFASGSDAGTSFAAMIRAIVNPTDDAQKTMDKLAKQTGFAGNIFRDAKGNLLPLVQIVANLEATVGRLEKGQQGEVLAKLVGGDAMRAALALLQQGSRGIEDLRSKIDQADIGEKLRIQMQGSEQATRNITNAWEKLKLAIADTGLLAAFTAVKNAIAAVVDAIASMPSWLMKTMVVAAALTAALGPLALAVTGIAKVGLALFVARLSPLLLGISVLINPVGTLVAVLGRLMLTLAGTSVLGLLGSGMMRLAGPIGIVVTAVSLLTVAWQAFGVKSQRSQAEQERLRSTLVGAKPALDKAAEAVANLTGKTGDAAVAARKHADAMMAEARAAIVAAQAIAQKRLQAATEAKARADRTKKEAMRPRYGAGDPGATAARGAYGALAGAFENAASSAADEAKAAAEGVAKAKQAYAELERAINAPSPTTKVKLDLGDADKTRRSRGRDTRFDGQNREQMHLDAEIEAARIRGDHEATQRLQDRLDLEKQVEAYQRTGLSLDQARSAAQRDMADLQAARATAARTEIADERLQVQLGIAQADADAKIEDSLARQAELKRRIAHYYALTRDLAEATRLAEADQADEDAARARVRERLLVDQEQDRNLALARARGDSEDAIRLLEREIAVRERARELGRQFRMDPGAAQAQAEREWSEEEKARQTGVFRSTFKDGIRAALDGDLKGWVKNWWKDRVAKGLEEALNSLADLIANLFAKAGSGAGAGGAGFFDAIGAAIGGFFGKKPTAAATGATGASFELGRGGIGSTPGFARGGSFKVGGRSGIDQNLVAFRATRGEMVDIRTPGNDNGGGLVVQQTITFSGAVDLATRGEVARFAAAAKQGAIDAMTERGRRRG